MKTDTKKTATAQAKRDGQQAAGGLKVRSGLKAGGTYNWGRI